MNIPIGSIYGQLTVIGDPVVVKTPYKGTNTHRCRYWLPCRCSCGKETLIREDHLTRKKRPVKSCGCLKKSINHGWEGTKLYMVWGGIIQRCTNPKKENWEYYGGKGIKVCEDWQTFIPFKDWSVSHGYKEGLTIDRIDGNGDYCPENCRWVPWEVNYANRIVPKHYRRRKWFVAINPPFAA